jgi:indole-3-glycerol phosphate synthase
VLQVPSAFIDALLAGQLPIIMEVKRSDGEGAELMGERTIAQVVSQYVQVGAPCISVVTGRWFGGEDAMLEEVAGLTEKPLLKKDFITREKQIVAAKEMGASAVLLTAKILPAKTFRHLIEIALEHELTPFVEVVDQSELENVIHPEDCVIAVNNKDINTREREPGDIDTSRSLLEATLQTGTPCPVSASAILDPRIAAELIDAGFKGLLIGTGLLRAPSIPGWVQEFERHRAELRAPVGAGAHPPTPQPPASA